MDAQQELSGKYLDGSCHGMGNWRPMGSYLNEDMCFRIVFIIASAWLLDESLRSPMTSVTPLWGRPFSALVAKAYSTPAHAPRFPSQFSGLGSSL